MAGAMSAKCQLRTFRYSFDECIGALLQAEWHVKTERLCGFEVYDQIELGWRLHGEVFRLGTLQNAIDIRRRLGKLFGEIVSISNSDRRPQRIRVDNTWPVRGSEPPAK